MIKGLKAVDDTTLQVTLTAPFSQFKTMLGYTAFYPLPKAFGADPKGFGEAPDRPRRLPAQGQQEAQRRDRPHDVRQVPGRRAEDERQLQALPTLRHRLQRPAPTTWTSIDRSRLGICRPYHEDLRRPLQSTRPTSGVGYIGFPIKYNKAFENRGPPQGHLHGDRPQDDRLEDLPRARTPADDFISPLIDGYRKGACGEACTLNPAKAKELYKASGGLPGNTLELGYNADGGHKEWIEAVANQHPARTWASR